ncbi:segregation and condensation protein A [Marinospirillum alkaliphilum]|uniref:Segregation and condensation protein A n=1 Tax=Marinospirillum alkaliphilum DSM 21637 TaxID=1122209 RepID=A0A1K1VZG7_9GAMM|nr:ScpA family protein [Marinospirillum alkaliphilum]SFX30391.1 condensin subunit ScpA [Marinospirillum alkaliphilum DSM 21637]
MNQPVPQQLDLLAKVAGEPFTAVPEDLFIPPEALRVFLEAFEGPLDLLLYLIRKHNLDVLSINVAAITHQYLSYLDLMQELQIELAAEYLVMASLLAEIKSRSLLPRAPGSEDDEDEEDPRAQLIRRLLEYEQFKSAAERLDQLPRQERDFFPANPEHPERENRVLHPDVELQEVLLAFARLLKKVDLLAHHQISREPLSTRERMSQVLERLEQAENYVPFDDLFDLDEGRPGMVVTFMALLELVKEQLVELVQTRLFAMIHVRRRLLGSDTDSDDRLMPDEVNA